MTTSSEHTPGPWTLDHDQLGLDLRNHIPVNAKSHTALAQVVWKMEDDERTPRCEANACLIAAAPDLLEALQNMLGLFDTPIMRRRFNGNDSYLVAIKLARSANTKATGGQA